jgi:hypothetical protein
MFGEQILDPIAVWLIPFWIWKQDIRGSAKVFAQPSTQRSHRLHSFLFVLVTKPRQTDYAEYSSPALHLVLRNDEPSGQRSGNDLGIIRNSA